VSTTTATPPATNPTTPPRRPAPWTFHNGEIIRTEDLRLTASTQALNYGTGVFEGIRAYWNPEEARGYGFRLREHYKRLTDSARLLRIDLGHTVDELCGITIDLLRRNAHRGDTYIRPLAYKLALEPGTRFGVGLRGVSSALTISTLPMGSYIAREGIRCGVSGWRRIPAQCLPARAKITGGYANNALALDDVQTAGFDDAIMLDVCGSVTEATTANVFVVSDGELVTPPRSADLLPGITRAAVIEIAARELGIAVIERAVSRAELYSAEEVFLTGTGLEIAPVIDIDGRAVATGSVGPTTSAIRDLYQAIVRGIHPRYDSWLTSISFD
jgi:branched-chain amino acid aminotransferase